MRGWMMVAPLLALMALGVGCSERSVYHYWNSYRLIAPEASHEKEFTDETLTIRFWIDEKKIHFRIRNNTDQPLALHWDTARFINLDRKTHPVANGASIFTVNRHHPSPTIIEPGKEIVDFVAPVGNVKRLEEWTWYLYPLFNLQTEEAFENKGKVFGLDLPISRGVTTTTYSFRFEISHVLPYETSSN